MPVNDNGGWAFAAALWVITPRANPVPANTADAQFMAMRASIAYELNLVGKTRCAVCDGWGHNYKSCPTNQKLKHFSKAGISQSILKRVKDDRKKALSRINNGRSAPWSLLSAGPGFKRPRVMLSSQTEEYSDSIALKRRPRAESLRDSR